MQFSILTRKTATFYTACSPELALVSYGQCREEALNNLQDEVQQRQRGTTTELAAKGNSYAVK